MKENAVIRQINETNEEFKPPEEDDINKCWKECRYWADKWDKRKNSNLLKRMTSINDQKNAVIEYINETKGRIQTDWIGWHQ